ncbi:MAG TPA: serine hydrolase [Candidatus Saccharimonadales bacterium]
MITNIDRLKQAAWQIVRHRHVRRAIFTFHTLMVVVAVLAAFSIIGQLLYPAERALPFAKVDALDIGGLTREEIEQKLETLAKNATVKIKTPLKTYETKWASIGLGVDSLATTKAAISYSFWERFIPFSSVARTAQTIDTSPIIIVDKERLKAFANKIVAENKQAAVEANITIVNGRVVLREGKGGFAFTVEDVERQLQAIPFKQTEQVTLQPQLVTSSVDSDELVATKLRTEQVVGRELTIKIGDKTFQPDVATRGSWLQVGQDPVTHVMAVQFNKSTLSSYLTTVAAQVAAPAGVTQVTLLDGQEIKRVVGATGKSIDIAEASKLIEKALFNEKTATNISLALIEQPPAVTYTKTYSQSDAGLLALIRDWEAETYGTYGIIVREIGGQNRYAEFQPDYSFVTASTYKMFIAYDIFTKMERNEINNETVLDNGWTVDACMNEMILHSTNPCAISFQNWLGWQTSEDMIHEAGFLDTFVNNQGGGEKHSTVRDETNFMLRLHSGTLLNDEHTQQLLSLFKRQVWRGGIPAGVPGGTVVADKVGFYNGYVHDVGIVYAPRATYILGVMSRGGSDPVFADLSRRVYNFFNR